LKKFSLKVEEASRRNLYTIDSAWLERGSSAGETLRVSRTACGVSRGGANRENNGCALPETDCARTMLRVNFGERCGLANRASRGFAFAARRRTEGIDQLIGL